MYSEWKLLQSLTVLKGFCLVSFCVLGLYIYHYFTQDAECFAFLSCSPSVQDVHNP